MNGLELALEKDNMHVDIYLEDTSTSQIRADIEDIRKKAALSTSAGKLKEDILEFISNY